MVIIFTWTGKEYLDFIINSNSNGRLIEYKEESVNFDETENLYIEGDNLEVLKLLQKSYYGKIKMIYIDPPYNTGNDFVYKDNFKDNLQNYLEVTGQVDGEGKRISANQETAGRYHSNWLNMMYPRLFLARNLLTDDGVIFISIDDNEVHNLRKICDEIFGEENFLSILTIIVKTEGRRYGFFAKTHENILIYSKNNELVELNEIDVEGKTFSFFDEIGGFNIKDLRNQNTRAFNDKNRPNLRYPFYINKEEVDENGFFKVYIEKEEKCIEIYPIEVEELKSVWRWGKDKSSKELYNLVAKKSSDGIYRVFQKYRKLTEMPKTVWINKNIISNKGTKELLEIFNDKFFDFPKPLKLLIDIINISSNENDIILDFFSGSATTAHAVMQLNAEDEGNRKYIMVQLPETTDEKSEAYKAGYKNICEIGKERIRRAGKKIIEEKRDNEGIDIGFKVLKLE